MRSLISKSFTFHAAHVIPHHRGKCSRLHGHTYQVDVEVEGDVQLEGAEAGMVMDFDRIKRIWSEHLEPILDHQNLNETLEGKVTYTTAECIADFLLDSFRYHLGDLRAPLTEAQMPRVVAVRVWETPTSYAEAR
jgi:6-pyruvoyltetrahydropterin/6-carboxytetrahydropterin synthase